MSDKTPINRADHSKAVLKKMADQGKDVANFSPTELFSFVWKLTKEVYSLSGDFDAEQRLQRNVVKLIRQ